MKVYVLYQSQWDGVFRIYATAELAERAREYFTATADVPGVDYFWVDEEEVRTEFIAEVM